jgi:hypothetical protein
MGQGSCRLNEPRRAVVEVTDAFAHELKCFNFPAVAAKTHELCAQLVARRISRQLV